MSQREAARHFNISRDSVRKMLAFSVPPRISAHRAREAAEAGRVHRDHRRRARGGSRVPPQAAAHGQAGVRPAARWRGLLRHWSERQWRAASPAATGIVVGRRDAGLRPEALHRGPGLDQRAVDREMVSDRSGATSRCDRIAAMLFHEMSVARSRSRFLAITVGTRTGSSFPRPKN